MLKIPIEDTIDLHMFKATEVGIVVEEYLYQVLKKGLTHVLIIHGRGIGVQREIVHSILKKHASVVEFYDLPHRGSTTVTLRNSSH